MKKKKLNLSVIDGFNFPPMFEEESLKSARSYKAKDDDLFVSTYPKCGTTWLQQICVLLFKDGEAPVGEEFLHRSPFLEMVGA
ncbi:Sulfotransferase 1C2-like protein, partial [Leptotrombidium deliense]